VRKVEINLPEYCVNLWMYSTAEVQEIGDRVSRTVEVIQ
jgi:hypothetical protein